MQLEALAAKHGNFENCRPTALGISKIDDVYSVDWAPLIPMLMNESDPVTERAAHFHLSMADSLLQQAKLIRVDTAINRVGLAGGVFQNRVLTEKCIELLNKNGFEVTLPLTMPVNDAAISFGQIVEYGYNRR